MKRSKTKLFTILLILTLTFIGCAQPDMDEGLKTIQPSESKKSVAAVINLPNEFKNPITRTVLPNELVPAYDYTISIENIKTKEKTTFTNKTAVDGKIELEAAAQGTYKVYVEGHNEDGLVMLKGESTENLIIDADPNTIAEITVLLKPMFGKNLFGNMDITIDWTQMLSDGLSLNETQNAVGPFTKAVQEGELRFELYLGKFGQPLNKVANTVVWKAAESTGSTYTCHFTDVPTGNNLFTAITIKDSKDNVIADKIAFQGAQIYANQTSQWKNDGATTFYINYDFWYPNIVDLEVSYPALNPTTSMVINWTDPSVTNGTSGYSEIHFTIGKMGESTSTELPVFKPSPEKENSITITGLQQRQQYYITSYCIATNGQISDVEKWTLDENTGFMTKIELDEITFTGDIAKNLVFDDSFSLSATINPSDATYNTLNWEPTEKDVVKIFKTADTATESVNVIANKPGITKIKVTNNDPISSVTNTTSNDIKVVLATPVNLTTEYEKDENGQTVGARLTWNNVNYAEEYIIYKSVNSGDFIEIGKSSESSFVDPELLTGQTYSYQVKATAPSIDKYYTDKGINFSADSAISKASAPFTTAKPGVTMKLVNITDQSFTLSENKAGAITTGNGTKIITIDLGEEVILSLDAPIEGMVYYAWIINGHTEAPVVSGKTYEAASSITLSNKLPFLSIGTGGIQQVSLVVMDGDENIYTLTTQFSVILHPVESVAIDTSLLTADLRYPITDSITLKASVMPRNASLKLVEYSLADEKYASIATIDPATGVITVKASGVAVFKVTSIQDPLKSGTVEITFYKQTLDSPMELLNGINKIVSSHISTADNAFDGDWWKPSSPVWTAIPNVSIKGSWSDTWDHPAIQRVGDSIVYSGYTENIPGIGDVVLNATKIATYAQNLEGSGNLGTDPLYFVGYDDGSSNKITITLPYEQGTATITINKILVDNNKLKNPEIQYGSYDITINDSIIVNGKSIKGSYHIDATNDLRLKIDPSLIIKTN